MVQSDNDNDPIVQHSSLERRLSIDGVTVKVLIYRALALDLRWTLEVIDHEGGSTCWDELFRTDHEALEAFEERMSVEGIRSFIRAAIWH